MNEEPPKVSDVLEMDDTTTPTEHGWRRTEYEKYGGNRHERRAERAKQRKLLKQVKRMQVKMRSHKQAGAI